MTASPGPHVPPSYHGPDATYLSATTTLHHNDELNIRDRLSAHLVSTSLSPEELDEDEQSPVPATRPTPTGPSASFLEPAKHSRANRPPGAQPYPGVGSQPSVLDRRCSAASIRPPSPHFPSMALALSRSTSAPGAVYIDWEEDDKENPMNWPLLRRWGTVICCFGFTGATAAVATAYAAAESQVTADFGVSKTVFLLGNTTYLVAVAFAPLVLAPFSELVGRRLIFIISAFLTAFMVLPQALAPNIEAILIARAIQGAAASAGNSVTGGIVADTFSSHERGLPMSFFTLCVFAFQGVAPLCSSYTVLNYSWRISFWWQGALTLASAILMLLFFKETRGPVLLSRRAAAMTKACNGRVQYRCRADDEKLTIWQMIVTSVSRPLIYLLTEPIVIAFSLWIGVLWACIFLSVEAIPIAFGGAYGWSAQQSSIVLLILSVGGGIGWLFNLWQERMYEKAWRKHNGDPPAEARLYACSIGALMVPVGLLWFAWGARSGVHPAVPIVGLVVFATGVFPIYMAVFVYLSDIYMRYASSALAAQSWLRNTLAGCFPLFVPAMYNNLTPPIATTVLACISLVLGTCPFVLMAFGGRIRAASRVAKALEKEEMEMEEKRREEHAKRLRRQRRQAEKDAILSDGQGAKGQDLPAPRAEPRVCDFAGNEHSKEAPAQRGEADAPPAGVRDVEKSA